MNPYIFIPLWVITFVFSLFLFILSTDSWLLSRKSVFMNKEEKRWFFKGFLYFAFLFVIVLLFSSFVLWSIL